MPEHTSFLSFLISMFPALGKNMEGLGHTVFGKQVGEHNAEPIMASAFVVLLIIALAMLARNQIKNHDKSVIPDDKLTLRTFWELFVGYFYDMMKDMMGPSRAKRYFPIVGTLACFIFFSNFIGQIPGFLPPTSNLSITLGCALVSLVAFCYFGFKENGFGFITHLFGPYMGPVFIPINILIFLIEFLSTFIIRPVTLSVRLMLNIAVDHLLVSISLGIFALFLPIPILMLGTLVCVVQTLVFALLTSIYITLATEGHEDHGGGHGHDDAEEAGGEKARAAH
jgi:F-type H+-transporting ATPase subunit a